ncbi:MAG TPA: hypothetical protein VEC16_02980 [Alphaproteobacteria bacterium]|nr:hypothetical protein [Alphaproteobacteria bacterium]
MWEISMIALKNGNYVTYKVTRRFPDYYESETKFFYNKAKALKQFNEWIAQNSS